MSGRTNRRDELEQALLELGDRAMVLEELDGFIAGVLVCPELIPPGEWFATAIGLSSEHPAPFTDLEHANAVLGLVMLYYNDVATTLTRHPEGYRPLFPIDRESGDTIWELWIDGFATAADLRPQVWEQLIDVGGETADAFTTLAMLTNIATGESDWAEEEKEVAEQLLSENPEELIRTSVLALNVHRLAMQKPNGGFGDRPKPFVQVRKVGRNEPCPCGSGKKYKRCCGSN
jgi:uncharacterized protein